MARSEAAGEGPEDTGSHLGPAFEDWPRGFGESSVWPLLTGLAAAGIYVGAGLFLISRGPDPLVPGLLAPLVLIPSVGGFLAGVFGWVFHGFVRDYWRRPTAGDGVDLRWGMVLFLATDVMTFGAGFVYYFFIRTGPWPPGELPHLLSSLVLVNTAVLLTSSGTLFLAERGLERGNRNQFLGALGVTLLLGVAFIGGQLLEYYEFIVVDGVPITSVYFSAFFGLTGLHGLHVTLGAVLLAIVFARGLRGQFSRDRHTAITTVAMYWHFVDFVWVFLVVTLYVGATA